MSSCSVLACLMVFLQDANARADMRAQLRHGEPSRDDVAWIQPPPRRPLMRIRGPYWSRGFELRRTTALAVWLQPGSPMPALGRTIGASVSVDF
jgi:hypothetical protein